MMSAGGAGGHTTKSQTPDSKEPIAGSKVKHPVKFSAKEKQRGREGKREEEEGREREGRKSSVQCQQIRCELMIH